MGITPDLSNQIVEFIAQYVPITEALKILLTLHAQPDKLWTLEELANESRQSAALVEDYVKFLQTNGLVVREKSRLRYAPASPELAAVNALVQAYNERPVSLIRAIYSPPPSSKAKSFADAFKIRKE